MTILLQSLSSPQVVLCLLVPHPSNLPQQSQIPPCLCVNKVGFLINETRLLCVNKAGPFKLPGSYKESLVQLHKTMEAKA
jgi:hypothetical protein